MKPLVYVAGPYTKPDPISNTVIAIEVGAKLMRECIVTPIVPHLSLLAELVRPRSYAEWLDYDIEVIEHCDAVLRLAGESSGADREVAHALRMPIPVFYDYDELYAWVDLLHSDIGEPV